MEKTSINPVAMVREFHQTMQLYIGDGFEAIPNKKIKLRVRLIAEETAETVHALTSKEFDAEAKRETLDGLCDIIVVSAGSVVVRGEHEAFNKTPIDSFPKTSIEHCEDNDHAMYRMNLANLIWKYARIACNTIRSEGFKAGKIETFRIHEACNMLNRVCYGVAAKLKLPLEAAFLEVHNANMSKRLKDGTVFKDAGGKLMKPPGFIKPDIQYVLDNGKPKDRPLYTEVDPNLYPSPDVIASSYAWTAFPPKLGA